MNPEHTPELAEIQKATLKVLSELDRVCTELSIRYVVYGGTAIGALRHGGFIPWDDDVDVCMPRADYERFLAEAPAIIGDDFEVLSTRSHEDYPKTFGLLGLKGSQFVPAVAEKRAFVLPIGVDLFPLDPIPDSPADFAAQSRRTWVWGRLVFLLGTPTPEISLPVPLKQLASAVMYATHWALRGLRIKPRTLITRFEKAARAYEGSASTLMGDFNTQDPRRWSADMSEMFPAQRMDFDGVQVMVAAQADEILRRGYGDYMTLPPEDQRVNHSAVRVVLGPNAPKA